MYHSKTNYFQALKQVMYALLLLIFLTSTFFACENNSDSSNDSGLDQIPALLQRPKKIQAEKEWDTAQNFYAAQKKILDENPEDQQAKLNLATLFVREARVTGEHGHYYPAALQMCDEILDSKDLSKDLEFRTLMTKAGVQLSLHEFSKALETGMQALLLNDKNAQIYGVLVDANVELGNYEKAIEMADKMVSIKPDLRSYSRISYLREIHGDVNGAKEAMQLAVDAGYPGYEETAWTMKTLGDIYMNYGEFDKANIIYQSILQERPDYPFAVGALAEVQFKKENYQETEKLLKEAISIIPEVGFYVQLAELYKLQNKTEQFQSVVDEILVMLADDEKSGHNMNLEYVHLYADLLNDYEKAMAYAQKEYEKRPDNIDVNQALAGVYLMKNEKELAEAYLEKASRTNVQRPSLKALISQL